MKILIIFKGSFPKISGADNMALLTGASLSSHCSVVVAQGGKELGQGDLITNENYCRISLPDDWDQVKRKLLELSYDLIHIINFVDEDYLRLAREVALGKGVPLCATPATDYRLWDNRSAAHELCQSASRLYVLTEAERADLECIVPGVYDKCKLLPNAPAIAPPPYPNFYDWTTIPKDAPIILFLGRKIKTKGVDILLRASERVWRNNDKAHFVFLGPRDEATTVLFNRYSFDPRIIEIDQVNEQMKASALQACTMLCLPTQADVFPLVLLEAWSFGKPVLTSALDSLKQIVLTEGVTVEGDENNWSEAISLLLSDPALRSSMGAAGKERTKRDYTWRAVAEELLADYRAILEGRG